MYIYISIYIYIYIYIYIFVAHVYGYILTTSIAINLMMTYTLLAIWSSTPDCASDLSDVSVTKSPQTVGKKLSVRFYTGQLSLSTL